MVLPNPSGFLLSSILCTSMAQLSVLAWTLYRKASEFLDFICVNQTTDIPRTVYWIIQVPDGPTYTDCAKELPRNPLYTIPYHGLTYHIPRHGAD